MTCVYAIVDPITEQRQYVGISKDPQGRFKHHLYNSHNLGLRAWVEKMAKKGIKPKLVILQKVDCNTAPNAEARWIARSKRDNPLLFNKAMLTAVRVSPAKKKPASTTPLDEAAKAVK